MHSLFIPGVNFMVLFIKLLCVIIAKEQCAIVIGSSYGDKLELKYFERKEGLPYGIYWVLKENGFDLMVLVLVLRQMLSEKSCSVY